jgi:hypothetical protein
LVDLKDVDTVLILHNDGGSGYFYHDAANTDFYGDVARTVLRATSLSDLGPGAQPASEVVLVGRQGSKTIWENDYSSGFLSSIPIALGKVDTDRTVSDVGKKDHVKLQDATLQDLTVIDLDNDGFADIVALTNSPSGYLITYKGTLTGANPTVTTDYTFVIASNPKQPNVANPTADGENNGIKISGNDGLGLSDTLVGILPTHADSDNGQDRVNDVVVIDYNKDKPFFNELSFQTGANPPDFATAHHAGAFLGKFIDIDGDNTILAFDSYRQSTFNPSDMNYELGYPLQDDRRVDELVSVSAGLFGGFFEYDLQHQGVLFTAGNGGEGFTGTGGAGGTIGKSLRLVNGTAVGSFDVTLPMNDAYEGVIRMVGGDGGKGFRNGGAGGDVIGVAVKYPQGTGVLTSTVLLFAGNGGESVTRTGGAGGDLSSLSIATGELFSGGNGGKGVIGGKGGSVIGNVIPGFTDVNGNISQGSNVEDAFIVAVGGNGGKGVKQGGDAGGVSKFRARFLPLIGGQGGLIHYVGGVGGDAVSGRGGNGGDIVDSSPVTDANNLVGNVFVQGGAGGRGTTGGNGGDVRNVINTTGSGSLPLSINALAGNGGVGTAGNGGAGGDITNVKVTANNLPGFQVGQYFFDFSNPRAVESLGDAIVGFTPLFFGRVIAGEGGTSFGGRGGSGGNITSSSVGITSSSLAVAAGAGGDGLKSGGVGGNVTNSDFDASGAQSKLVIIAGDGGDAYSGNVSATKPLLFGGIAGTGGNGGSITGVRQLAGTDVHVDLIAGNGGNTINDGTSQSVTSRVGNGGSINNVFITGDIGNVDTTTAIKAYNNIFANQRVADFVANSLVAAPAFILNDSVGNVGIVVGAKGRVQDENHDGVLDPSTGGTNGSLSNVTAQNIMSAVAGSVDRIASIASITNLNVSIVGGVYGADKVIDSTGAVISPDGHAYSAGPNIANLDYLSAGTPASVPATVNGHWQDSAVDALGGKLVDGAILGGNVRPLKSVRDFFAAQ